MHINKSDLPYLYEDASPWITLENGVEQRVVWDYSIVEASVTLTLGDEESPILLESIRRRQNYRFADYLIIASAVDEWQYLNNPDADYSEVMLGWRGYWNGEIYKNDQLILQPEVAVLLGFTNDIDKTPAYIETVSMSQLQSILTDAQKLFEDDDAIAFHKCLPIETPSDAPNCIFDALRRTRAQSRIQITRGRAALIDMLMKTTCVIAENGGWRILPEEIQRRQELGLR